MTDSHIFHNFLRPRSVAIVGASPQPGSPRNLLVKNLVKHGFQGAVYPVSPSHAEVEGLKAYKTVGDLPEVPDVALVITPAQTVAGVIAECGRKGIRNAVVFSSGFEEVEGGEVHARALAEAARTARRGCDRAELQRLLVGAAKGRHELQRRGAQDREDHPRARSRPEPERRTGRRHRHFAQSSRHGPVLHRQRRQRNLPGRARCCRRHHRTGRCASGGSLPRGVGRTPAAYCLSHNARASAACRSWP